MAKRAAAPVLTLGSASPRRAALLSSLDLDFVVESVDIDEAALVAGDPIESVARIAKAKFEALGAGSPDLLLTADTLVVCQGEALGKPASAEHLTEMLQQMSAQSLTIATAVCLGLRGAAPTCDLVTTTVGLRALDATEIERYVASGAGDDKAGGLALQAEAARFIASVQGCWSNVLGLPICAVSAALDHPASGEPRAQRCSIDLCGSSR